VIARLRAKLNDRRDDEAWKPGELWRQADIFGTDKGDPGVDEIADDADRREGRNLFGRAPVDGRDRLDRLHT
jgi:hypothetical protein